MQRNNIRSKQNREIQRTTFILDELSIIISFFLAIAVRFKAIINWIDLSYGIYVSMLITVLIFCVIIFYAYDSRLDNVVVQDPIDNLVSTVKSRLFLGLMAIVYFYVAQKDVLTSRVVMVFFFLFSAILGYIFRMLYRHFYISRKGIPEVYRAYEIRLPVTDLNPIIEEIREVVRGNWLKMARQSSIPEAQIKRLRPCFER